jgi:hypothetical protein
MKAASSVGSGLNARVGILGEGVPSANMLIRFCPPHVKVLSPLQGVLHSLLSFKFAIRWMTPSHPETKISITYVLFDHHDSGDVQHCYEETNPGKIDIDSSLNSVIGNAHLPKLDASKPIRK